MFSAEIQIFITALTIWREARGTGLPGMTAVGWAIKNRSIKYNTTLYATCTKRWAFSSINSADDPQLSNWPQESDTAFGSADLIAQSIYHGTVEDPTGGATLYFDDSEKKAANFNSVTGLPKSWNPSKVKQTLRLGTLTFFKEF